MSDQPFKIGDRVRIRVSAECAVRGEDGGISSVLKAIWHPLWTDGLTGTIMDRDDAPELSSQEHWYLVRWDFGRWVDGLYFRHAYYAAFELESL